MVGLFPRALPGAWAESPRLGLAPRRVTFSMKFPALPPECDSPITDLSLDMLRGIPIHPDHRGAIRFHADQIARGDELLVKALNTLLDMLPAAPPSSLSRRVPPPTGARLPESRTASRAARLRGRRR